jgi:ribosome-associated toxin RatA of RatAB toxin-antitoxin module
MERLNLSDYIKINQEKAFKIISAIDLYPEYVPGYKKVKLLEKTEKYIKADITPTIPIKNILMEAHLKPYEFINFKQITGPLDTFEGIWHIVKINDNLVKVDFSLKYYVKNFILRKLVYKFVKISFKDIITSFKIRAEQLGG